MEVFHGGLELNQSTSQLALLFSQDIDFLVELLALESVGLLIVSEQFLLTVQLNGSLFEMCR